MFDGTCSHISEAVQSQTQPFKNGKQTLQTSSICPSRAFLTVARFCPSHTPPHCTPFKCLLALTCTNTLWYTQPIRKTTLARFLTRTRTHTNFPSENVYTDYSAGASVKGVLDIRGQHLYSGNDARVRYGYGRQEKGRQEH